MQRAFQRPSGCLSDLVIDRLIVGELDDAARVEALGHAAACTWCTARIAELRGEQQAFAAGPVPLALHRPKRRFLGLSAALAAAAALALVFLPDRSGPEPEPAPVLDDLVRTKGAAHVGLYVERDGKLSPLLSGEHIVPGARVQPTYTATEPGHLAIFGIDGAGRVQRHYPADGPESAPVRPRATSRCRSASPSTPPRAASASSRCSASRPSTPRRSSAGSPTTPQSSPGRAAPSTASTCTRTRDDRRRPARMVRRLDRHPSTCTRTSDAPPGPARMVRRRDRHPSIASTCTRTSDAPPGPARMVRRRGR
ncbi:hypothetical protein [Nannocystis pusilla]|uniref:hypothetical protein n=1 Tax=Nannocystis pusilla TaxID=889268 RepID=UPI003B793E02